MTEVTRDVAWKTYHLSLFTYHLSRLILPPAGLKHGRNAIKLQCLPGRWSIAKSVDGVVHQAMPGGVVNHDISDRGGSLR